MVYKKDIILAALVEFMVYRKRQTLSISQNCLIINLISTMKARSGGGAWRDSCPKEAAFELGLEA